MRAGKAGNIQRRSRGARVIRCVANRKHETDTEKLSVAGNDGPFSSSFKCQLSLVSEKLQIFRELPFSPSFMGRVARTGVWKTTESFQEREQRTPRNRVSLFMLLWCRQMELFVIRIRFSKLS